jgi:hypothetical protein
MAGGIERIRVLVLEGLPQGGLFETVLLNKANEKGKRLDLQTVSQERRAKELTDWAERIIVVPRRSSGELEILSNYRDKSAAYSTNFNYVKLLRDFGIKVFVAPKEIDELVDWIVRK